MTYSYTLTQEDQATARRLAEARRRNNRQAGIDDQLVCDDDPEKADLEGMRGEIAFCKLAGVPFDDTTDPRKGGPDCTVNGLQIDVKQTARDNGRLLCATSKDTAGVDVYALVIGSYPGPYEFVGWARASELLQDANLTDLGYGPVYALDQDRLHAPDELLGRDTMTITKQNKQAFLSLLESSNGSKPNMLSWALAYAGLGFYVVPLHEPTPGGGCTCGNSKCKHQGKHPRISDWNNRATTDPAAIRSWWARWPDANIGIATNPSGLVVLDNDPRNGGAETWELLRDDLDFDTDTPNDISGGGGWHYLYGMPNGMSIDDFTGADLGPGVDIVRNGQIVAPPSLHPSGNRYEWPLECSPAEVDIKTLPDVLIKAMMTSKAAPGDVGDVAFTDVWPDVSDLDTVLMALDPPGDMALYDLITDPPGEDRSKDDQSAVTRLVARGASPNLIRSIMAEYPIGAKFQERSARGNGKGEEYLAHGIRSARAYLKKKEQQSSSGRGRPRKRRLVTDEYIDLYRDWGYDARLNLCNDDVEVNGEILTDVIEDQIKAKVRDFGIDHYISTNVQHAAEALVTMGARRAYHPVKDYLESLQWDGGQYIAELTGHFDDKEGKFARWFEHWVVGSVARVYEGFQNPMLVLDGPQDAGKSYFARWLCPLEPYFLESPIYPENKDHKLRLIQTWVWEVSELGTTTRKADVEALKAFLTMQIVRERKAYGRRDITKPALASFIGTINNESGFLVDRTGNRRFLVCTLESIDWDYSKAIDVNQVWAEALHRYRKDDSWKLTVEEKTDRDERNEEYLVDDPIEVYILKNYEFTGDELDYVLLEEMLSSLDMYSIRPTRGTTMAISSVMKKYGALKKRETIDGTRQRLYYGVKAKPKKKDDQDTEGDDDYQSGEAVGDEIAELGGFD